MWIPCHLGTTRSATTAFAYTRVGDTSYFLVITTFFSQSTNRIKDASVLSVLLLNYYAKKVTSKKLNSFFGNTKIGESTFLLLCSQFLLGKNNTLHISIEHFRGKKIKAERVK